MMAVRAPVPISLNPSASSMSFAQKSSYPVPSRLPTMAHQDLEMSPTTRGTQSRNSTSGQATTPCEENVSTSTASDTRADNIDQHHQTFDNQSESLKDAKHGLTSPVKSGLLKVDTEKSMSYDAASAKEDEPPISVIHAPVGFGKFSRPQPSKLSSVKDSPESSPITEPKEMGGSSMSTTSSESVASDVTVTKLVTDNVEVADRTQIPPLQTQIPIAPEWTKTPRAQTRKDLGVLSRPGSSLGSLASISEAEDDHPDQPTDLSAEEAEDVTDRTAFFRNDDDEFQILQNALTECWTLCNTLAGLSYIHREKIFSRKGNMQQQAWRSCWRLCQNLYGARNKTAPMNVRLTLDLCREFCQALFDVRARDDETADSVLRVSFELNNHLFNTHDRNLPEAFSERTLDFYITLCHRLMKQRSSVIEETGSLLRACWSLAEMLFSIRQTRREERKADEELLSSAIQACWELCDLFREGWTQIRPERQTPRPAQTTLTQAFQQARQSTLSATDASQTRFFPETPTTIFEDITSDSPYEVNAPNIVVLPPGESTAPTSATSANVPASNQLHPRQTAYRWPTMDSTSSITTLSTTSSNSLDNSVRTIRSPSDDPNMALLKSLFVRAAMRTKRGFSPLASTTITTVSSLTSLPIFVKSLPEVAFGSQVWQMGLLDNYRKAVANDPTFRTLGVAANPTLLGMDGDETTQLKIRVDTARAIQTMVNGTFGWNWLKDLFRFAFDVHVEDLLDVREPS